ncbi:hypothetical protein [Ramlibacter tataouinensis]|uniref:hypothetical protein n=1 Tax=Ramlibacter tataouinensis TaxID=94132 RepID=UPI0011AE4884|nr:hypothetical protein [Ramlibacter tataouinensis]
MLFAITLLAGAATAAAAVAPDTSDPLKSPECGAAQLALERNIQDAAAGNAGARDSLAAKRKRALETCLGPQSGHAERAGAPPVPIAVPSPSIDPGPGKPAAPPAAATAPPPVRIPRPVAITTCDPGGCWDSEGRRLNFMGPVLIGPQGGVCSIQAGAVQCP